MRRQADHVRYLPTFVCTAEARSFSEAARSLSVTPAAVSKAVRALEEKLGVRLFHRTTHALTLTEDGDRLYREVASPLAAVEAAVERVSKLSGQPSGTLTVAAPSGFGKQLILPMIGEFRRRYPAVELVLRFDDQISDMVRSRIDVAIGLRLHPSPNLIGRRLCASRRYVVASPAFWAEHGVPQHPRDLESLPALRFLVPKSGRLWAWSFEDADGGEITVRAQTTIAATDQESLCELAARGQGVALVGLLAQPYLADGRLLAVLDEFIPPLPPMSLYYSAKENLPAKVRVFLDHMVEQFPSEIRA